MREIKFRAKGSDGKWYYFSLSELSNGETQTSEFCDIELSNWCEFTGLKEKDGTEIYEGDIFGVYSLIGDFAGNYEPTGRVVFDNDLGAYVVECTNGGWEYLSEYIKKPRYEVIDNIYENPELLK